MRRLTVIFLLIAASLSHGFDGESGNPVFPPIPIDIPMPVITIPDFEHITVPTGAIGAYITSNEARAAAILSDPNATITASEPSTEPMFVSTYGLHGYPTFLGECGHLVNVDPMYPVLKIEGNGDAMCWRVGPELRAPTDFDDIWLVLPNRDLIVVPSTTILSNADLGFVQSVMNPAEQALCNAEPAECYHVGLAIPEAALNAAICDHSQGDSTMANAIRHATWAALIAARFKYWLQMTDAQAVAEARKWLNAHESFPNNNPPLACASPLPTTPPANPTPTEMDCHNNETGLDIFLANSNDALFQLQAKVLSQMQVPGTAVVINPTMCIQWF